ncbi:P-loop NTPase fold protein [Lactobacillus sp. PSON]|uniref:P-loop NTPase fold protein n=1 Tax=Lactobacillus sp. PSON TaxID=3455454 RepID=UPI0040430B2F
MASQLIKSGNRNIDFEEAVKYKNFQNNINKFLDDIGNNEKLIVFIDELDKCNPNFSIKLLERIKHYFFNDNVVFVFSVDIEELSYSVNNFYGENFHAQKYLDRFFDSVIDIPSIDKKRYLQYLKNKNTDRSLNSSILSILEQICRVVEDYFNFQLRELAHFRVNIQALEERYYKKKNIDSPIIPNAFILWMLPLILGIKMVSEAEFQEFLNGNRRELFVKIVTI